MMMQMLLDHGGVEGRTASTVQEGSEPEGFWTAVGGMGEYPEASEAEQVSQEPRLFQVTIAFTHGSTTVVVTCGAFWSLLPCYFGITRLLWFCMHKSALLQQPWFSIQLPGCDCFCILHIYDDSRPQGSKHPPLRWVGLG